MHSPPALDREAARKFLQYLDPETDSFVFQTFDDSATRRNPALARTLHGTLDQHWSMLSDLSRRGAGIFVCINQTDKVGKRKTENIVRVRAYFPDFDKVPPATIKERISRFGLWPHLIVQSSRAGWHVYWRVADASLGESSTTQARLAAVLGGDPNVKDLPRVMRLPGFPHQKDGCAPFIVRIARVSDHSVIANADFQAALAAAERQAMPPTAQPRSVAADAAAGLRSSPDMTQGYPDGQRTRELTRRAGWCLGPRDMSEDETIAACLEWNRHNTPRLPEQKVRDTVASIAKSEGRKREAAAPLIDTQKDAAQSDERTPLTNSTTWHDKTFTAAELKGMTFEPLRYIVPRYVPEGVTLLIGRPKIGKSWLALDLAIACAADRPVLGSLKPLHGEVLYLALEDGKRRLQRRLDSLSSPFSPTWPEPLAFAPMGDWRRGDQGGLDDIEAWCASTPHPVLVVIDTLARFRKPADGKQQLYTADTDAIASLQKIALKYGIAILVLHHDRKAAADDPFDTVSGTLGLTGAADTILIFKRQRDGGVVLHARGRDIEESDTAVQFDKVTCRWSVLGEASEVRRSTERQRVIAALAEAGRPLSVSEIMMETNLKRNAADLLLGRMVKDGELKRVGCGKYGLPEPTADARQIGQKDRSQAEAPAIAG
jgi:hypothetical protein